MKILGRTIIADEGRAIHRKGEPSPSPIVRASLAPNDSIENWEDCDYGMPDEVTVEDKDAALRRFGVEV